MITLAIADDHPLFRSALIGALKQEFNDVCIHESDDLDSTIEMLQQHSDLDLLLLDLNMPGCGKLYGLIRIRTDFPDVPVAVISGSEDNKIISTVIESGALGFIPKTSEPFQYASAINSILEGDIWIPKNAVLENQNDVNLDMQKKVAELTPQQFKVLCYLHEGMLNKQIAYELNISEATIKAHITAIFRKLGVNNRTQAVLIASDLELSRT
ncbi:response regulator transcription factor [Marinomonas mediterranea]|uniref:Two component transcriptional regulator, LuxR family n=1 Tax=Marinomonas mediterranea (strain ATCC 700492 / JCM 21426 / NBRC 103028 / MMB-1) TaxID=717774 RepID=F2K2F6_MARM1|nr:response regulator transcription factor [Marinomonas mediterranea]ADZ92336.1 two component transcriptional regulator, LuxR family [Marinomonas mediterranea MMB-1]WCN10288.1 response regulator [Marinomonas mediterranea]WCN14334.1 response regulator [Marinomonas mediterranea]WCN18385.1 response regulator [Marinomonas mediterranea MMB-1]